MKAAVFTEYGPPEVLHIAEVNKPTPGDNEILIRIHATSVGYGDVMVRDIKNMFPHKFHMPLFFWPGVRLYFGIRKPKRGVLGAVLAGEVESVGKDVTQFSEGDQVFAYVGQSMGAYAEYRCMPEDGCVATMPANMSYEEAAVVPYGAIMASTLLEKMNIQPGQKVLVNGASGSIGSAAVQLAKKHYGAEVTGVCGTPRQEFVKALGADHVIDYTNEDFTRNGETYDLIFDIYGKCSFSRAKGSLTPKGRILYCSFKMKHLLQMLRTKLFGGRRVICEFASDKAKDLLAVKELIEAGKIKAIIDRSFPLEQAAEAHRYVEDGYAKGHIVITV